MRIKKKLWFFVTAGLAVLALVFFFVGRTTIKTPYHLHSFKTVQLENGLELLLVSDNTLPYLSYELLFKEGGKIDPPAKMGLMSLLSQLMDKGAGRNKNRRSAVQLAEDLELLGSPFGIDLGRDYTAFSVDALSWLGDNSLSVFAKIITQPELSKTEFERAQQKAIGSLKRSSENFGYTAHRIFKKYVLNKSPYGSYLYGSLKTLKNIQIKDIKNAYQTTFRPDQAVLGISGRLPKDIIKKVKTHFSSWRGKALALRGQASGKKSQASDLKIKNFKPQDFAAGGGGQTNAPQLLLVDHPAAVQSEIRLGHISIASSHPDYLAMRTANVILGDNSMGSHLMRRLRVKKGLTYHVYSQLTSHKELGVFSVGMAVRNSRLGDALLEIRAVLESFYKNGITPKELKEAKTQLTSRFIRNMASVEDFTHYLMYLSSQNLPYSFAQNYLQNIQALDVKTVNRMIKKYLHPGQIQILVLSRAKEAAGQLQDYQPLIVKSYKDFL